MYMHTSTGTTHITAQTTEIFIFQETTIATSEEMTMARNIPTGRLVTGMRALETETN